MRVIKKVHNKPYIIRWMFATNVFKVRPLFLVKQLLCRLALNRQFRVNVTACVIGHFALINLKLKQAQQEVGLVFSSETLVATRQFYQPLFDVAVSLLALSLPRRTSPERLRTFYLN